MILQGPDQTKGNRWNDNSSTLHNTTHNGSNLLQHSVFMILSRRERKEQEEEPASNRASVDLILTLRQPPLLPAHRRQHSNALCSNPSGVSSDVDYTSVLASAASRGVRIPSRLHALT